MAFFEGTVLMRTRVPRLNRTDRNGCVLREHRATIFKLSLERKSSSPSFVATARRPLHLCRGGWGYLYLACGVEIICSSSETEVVIGTALVIWEEKVTRQAELAGGDY